MSWSQHHKLQSDGSSQKLTNYCLGHRIKRSSNSSSGLKGTKHIDTSNICKMTTHISPSAPSASIDPEHEIVVDCIDDYRGPIIPTGELLDDRFNIQQLLRRENHADVYLVVDKKAPLLGLEARAFNLLALPPRLKKHRLRAMKRLSSRTVNKTKWKTLDVIVYWTGHASDAPITTDNGDSQTDEARALQMVRRLYVQDLYDQADDIAQLGLGTSTKNLTSFSKSKIPQEDSTCQVVKKSSVKSEYKRESERLRQRDRRQAKHRRNKEAVDESKNENVVSEKGGIDERSEIELDDETLAMLTLLHIAHSARPELRKLLPESSRLVVDNYILMKDREPALNDEEEMEEFARIKEREIAYLRRQVAKVHVTKVQCHDHMGELLRRQLLLPKHSADWKQMQEKEIKPAKEKFRILQAAIKILPDTINTAEECHRSVLQKLQLWRQEKKAEQERLDLEAKRDKLRKKMESYNAWKCHVVPASDTFAQLHSKYEMARKQLDELEKK